MLREHDWEVKYTPDSGDLVERFYIPALEDAVRYDRLSGYFNAGALGLAARGIEGLVRNNGRMRLIVGCTLEPPEIDAISRGEEIRGLVERGLRRAPLEPPDTDAVDALELLAWMVSCNRLEVKIGVPCDAKGAPTPDGGIFHEKAGIIEDLNGDRLAWNGSLNETSAGWQYNWESISIFTSWGVTAAWVAKEEENFTESWADNTKRLTVLDLPEAMRRDLMRFMPKSGRPRRLRRQKPIPPTATLKTQVWAFIRNAPSMPGGGENVGAATAAVTPWPHQARAFERLYGGWPTRLLIADEVGLGKTVQAGLLLRQAWLAGRAKRILILAPKAVLGQWQIELREKFNLNWPIYDSGRLTWYPSPALKGRNERDVGSHEWHLEPAVIASSHLMRRQGRAREILEAAEPWDLVVLDEAHHARRRSPGSPKQGGPNTLLRLMRGLRERTQGLLLLTATPMQVHPVEVWDLLDLLGLPPEWTEERFLAFFKDVAEPNLSADGMERIAALFRSSETAYGTIPSEEAQKLTGLSPLNAKRVLRALRDDASIPRRQLEAEERTAAVKVMQAATPVRRLVSRNTRELLRRYFKSGTMTTPIAERRVEDCFLTMSEAESGIYDTLEDYIAEAYRNATGEERKAVGFVMTIYRRRLASSFTALRATLRKRRAAITAEWVENQLVLDEDLPDDDAEFETLDVDDAALLEQQALAIEQQAVIDGILDSISRLPPDSKLSSLRQSIRELRQSGYSQVMIFTQYTDTMDFLREALAEDGEEKLLCFSGRGGEAHGSAGDWHAISRDEAKRRFRDGQADILVCTDAAAEGLNFQFCGAVVNYDMPWNPMRVEQRIGRIDRLGQRHEAIRIVNLHYEGTVEADIYRALRNRIGLFESVVGPLQPILAKLPGRIQESVLAGAGRDARKRSDLVDAINREAGESGDSGFDINAVTESDLTPPDRPPSTVTMTDLDRIIRSGDLMDPDVEVEPMGSGEYKLLAPEMTAAMRVTTDREYFEEHAESLELWSPGNPLFKPPEDTANSPPEPTQKTLKEVLDGGQSGRPGIGDG